MSVPADPQVWGPPDRPLDLVARNVSTRYLAIFVDGAIGLVLLPFNVAHLGPSAYGLWILVTSVTWFFGVLDLGYGGAAVKFIAQYRAWRDRNALNEILSTIGVVFTGTGIVCFLVTLLLAWRVDALFNIEPEQARTARYVLLIVGGYLSVRFAFAIFGAVVYGFQRYYLNNAVSIGISLAVAAVNVGVLSAGNGLVALVAATTAVRLLSLGLFTWNAYRVFPGLHVRPSLFRRTRLKEVTGFSVYMLVLDWSAKLNYSSDTLVIGAMLDTTAVAVWKVGQSLAQLTQQLTSQLNDALFPSVVDSDAAQRHDRLQMILVQGTKLSLALAAPLCVGLIMLAEPLIHGWVGTQFSASILPTQIMLTVVLVRISTASANLILRGAGQHRLLASTNATVAVVNILLSIALIRPFGLLGVAVGTLIPVTASAAFVLYPAACRRVDLPIGRPLVEAIWPAMWPAVIMIGALWLGRQLPPAGLLSVAAHLAAGGLVYAGLFLGLAIGAVERRFYWMKLRGLVTRHRRAPAAG
ncbi:MAG TPA: oligosaccharide flippase family protein [Vicinamibacterales bacterium]|nr:oligosaccharide flippase family protein [Vicinamibacterales bacterium]